MKRHGFCIFINTVVARSVPCVRGVSPDDGDSTPDGVWIFRTELEAQREIADRMITRLQEFLDGERDFEDAISLDEYVVGVEVLPDGQVVDVEGRAVFIAVPEATVHQDDGPVFR
jgi:hypothetical protein